MAAATSVLERELEAQAAVGIVVDADVSPMHAHGVFHDGKTEARAAHLAAPALVHAIETLEQAREMLLGNAHAVVAEGELPTALAATRLEIYVGIGTGIGNGIVGEVAEGAVYQALVAIDNHLLGYVARHAHAFLFKRELALKLHRAYDSRHVDLGEDHHLRTIVETVERRHVVEQRRETLALHVASLQEVVASLGIHAGMAEYGLQVALYARHGCLQLVRHVLGEFPLEHALLLLRLFQAKVKLHYAFGGVAKLVVGEPSEHLVPILVERESAGTGASGKLVELGYIASDAAGETIEHYGEQDDHEDGEPYIM